MSMRMKRRLVRLLKFYRTQIKPILVEVHEMCEEEMKPCLAEDLQELCRQMEIPTPPIRSYNTAEGLFDRITPRTRDRARVGYYNLAFRWEHIQATTTKEWEKQKAEREKAAEMLRAEKLTVETSPDNLPEKVKDGYDNWIQPPGYHFFRISWKKEQNDK